MNQINYQDFENVEIRVGRIKEVHDFPEARKPAYKLFIDFGSELGIKKSSAQITDNYNKTTLQDMLVLAVVNFPPRQVGPFLSEVLTLGFYKEDGTVILAVPEQNVPLGTKLL
jgi:tRNA-binding protein